MPIYQYKCSSCSCEFELKKSFSESAEGFCPECGGPARRLFSAPAVIFKGSGFYCTDHRGNACLSSSESEKEKEKTPTAKSEFGDANKAAAKVPTKPVKSADKNDG